MLLAIVVRAGLEQRRRDAAWRRVGSCSAAGTSPVVSCDGVHLRALVLPSALKVCRHMHPCTAKLNIEAIPSYEAALRDVVSAGLGPYVTVFDTVNRRRCKDALTGSFIAGCISKHSYGIAVDFRPFDNNARWNEIVSAHPQVLEVIAIFKRHGFRWGGTFQGNFDPQHLEWVPGGL
jgi:hypothetical protein